MLATLLLLADLAGSIAVSDRTEARGRAPGTAPASASFDLETAPAVLVTLTSRTFRATLAYSPRLTLWDVGAAGAQSTALHGGAAHFEWQTHLTHLSLDQTGTYGSMNFAVLPPIAGADGVLPHPELVPALQLVRYASSTTTLASRFTLRRWAVDMAVGYQLSGGVDAAARAALPFQAGPVGRLALDYSASRRDRVATTLSVIEATFSSGPASTLVEISEGYQHLLSRVAQLELAVGAGEAGVRTSVRMAPPLTTYPVISGVFDYRPTREGAVGVRLGARLGPVVNRLVGLVEERIEGTLALRHTYGALTTHAYAGASQSVPASRADATTLVAAELGAAYGLSPIVAFDAGLRGIWQRQGAVQASFLQSAVFFGVTLSAPPIRL